jgi:hypothetical protein
MGVMVFGLGDEPIPGGASGVEDIAGYVEDAV